MLLISRIVQGNSAQAYRFKAPKGYQYHVKHIIHSVFNAGDNELGYYDRIVDNSEVPKDIQLNQNNDLILGVTCNSTQLQQGYTLDHKTKYLSIAPSTSTNCVVGVFIYGDLIPLSKVDAIWEWIRKSGW